MERESLVSQRAIMLSSIPLLFAAMPTPNLLAYTLNRATEVLPRYVAHKNRDTAPRKQQSTCRLEEGVCFSVVQNKTRDNMGRVHPILFMRKSQRSQG